MRLAKGVPTGDEGNRLLIVHRHAGKGLTDVACRGQRVRVAIRAFRVHVDQAHLYRRQRIRQFTVSAVALVLEPPGLTTPIDVLVRLPHVYSAAAEPECLEAHRLECYVAGKNHQVRP